MKKNTLLLLLTIGIFFSSCKNSLFNIEGSAPGIKDAIIELKGEKFQTNTNITNDKFTLKGIADYPGFYTLSIVFSGLPPKHYDYVFYLESGDYTIKFDANDIYEYPSVETTSAIQKEINNFYAANLSEYDFIMSNPSSQFSAYLLGNLEEEINRSPEKYAKAFNNLDEEIKKNKYAQKANTQIQSLLTNQLGADMPKIYGQDVKGNTFDPNILKGKLTLIMFWATYDVTSRKHIPELQTLYKNYKDQGFEIVSLGLDENIDRWKNTVETYRMNWLNVNDFKGSASDNITSFNNRKIPYYILISPDLKILEHDVPLKSIEIYIKDHIRGKK